MSSCALKDKTLVVMGGTTGIGLSAALAFVKEGARVVVCGRNPDHVVSAQAELESQGLALRGDATDPDTAGRVIQAALDQFKGFHGYYHVAGGSGRRMGDGPLHEITDEGWDQTFKLNLTSLFYSNRAAVRQFLKQNSGGVILNMGSVLGDSPSPRFFATHAYAASKSAVNGFTKSCASFYASKNIRFNALAPALVETPMSQRASGNDEIMNYIRTKQPLDGGRIGLPSDLDAAAVYFMSDASRFITGQILSIDGGWRVSG